MKFGKYVFIIVLLAIIAFVVGGYYVWGIRKITPVVQEFIVDSRSIDDACLMDDEIGENSALRGKGNMGYFATSPVTIFVKDKITNLERRNFQISGNSTGLFTLQLFKCNIYVVRIFNYDPKKGKHDVGYKEELWKYNYSGNGEPIILMAEKPKEFISYYTGSFRVSPFEQYIALIKGYGGRDDHSIVIKDIKTLKDVFVLPITDVTKKNPEVAGDIGFNPGGWTSDGKYLWVNMFIGAEVYGFVRINTIDWTYEVLPAPKMTMGGDALNINNGMLTYGEDVAPWSGVVEIDQQIQKEAIQTGQISSFYIYNLFTKKKYLIATTTDPTYYFRPYWLSDTELQYELPTGEKKIYKINEK
ncbi:MAG: hypothetical protein AAB770_00845 [Patescibacteria group bacterium]